MSKKHFILLSAFCFFSCKNNFIPQTDIPFEVLYLDSPITITKETMGDMREEIEANLTSNAGINLSMSTGAGLVEPDKCLNKANEWMQKKTEEGKIPKTTLNGLQYASGVPNGTQCPSFQTQKLIDYALGQYLNSAGSSGTAMLLDLVGAYIKQLEKNDCFKDMGAKFRNRMKLDNFLFNVSKNNLNMPLPPIELYYVGNSSLTNEDLEKEDAKKDLISKGDIVLLAKSPKTKLGFLGTVDFERAEFEKEKVEKIADGSARLVMFFGPYIEKASYINEGGQEYFYIPDGEFSFSIGFRGSVDPSMGMDGIDIGRCFYKEIKDEAKDKHRKYQNEYDPNKNKREDQERRSKYNSSR